ncbi:MAG: hypothetical protein IIC50_04845 [Planctomycetes bacterium]|nr:hypothetical protein [Planctomycetota bacterium]
MSRVSELRMGETVVVLAKSETSLQAVEVRAKAGGIEMVWAKSGDPTDTWLSFARQCELVTTGGIPKKRPSKRAVALCVESIGVAFQEFTIPAVGSQETEAMVRMQAETRLPLPIEQMDIAWRTRPGTAGQCSVILAAARKGLLQSVADQLHQINPTEMVLEAEALVALWKHLCPRQAMDPVLIDVTSRRTLICNVAEGSLVHATVMDVGWADVEPSLRPRDEQEQEGQSPEALSPFELFVQDLREILSGYGSEAGARPVYVSTDTPEQMNLLAESLDAQGLSVAPLQPDQERLVTHSESDTLDLIFEYRLALGAALACLDSDTQRLRLFDRYCAAPAQDAKRRRSITTGVAAVVALLAMAIMLAGLYGIDVVKAQRLEELTQGADLRQILQEKAHQKEIARRRLNVPALLQEMGAAEGSGIVLDSLHFKEGQAIKVEGRADQEKQLHTFQEGLLGQRGIDKVILTRSSFNKKTKKFEFTLTFHYKTFTLKSAKS